MEAIRVAVAAVVVAVIAVAAGIALQGQETSPAAGTGTSTSIVPLYTTTYNGESSTSSEAGETTIPPEATLTESVFTSTKTSIVVYMDLPYVDKIVADYEGDHYSVSLIVQLPNPCYNASATYMAENNTIVVKLKSPPPKTMCIQVVEQRILGPIEVPAHTRVDVVVFLDNKPSGRQAATLP